MATLRFERLPDLKMYGVFPFLLLKQSTRALSAFFISLTTSDRTPP
jgi:hypothetical protein